MKNAFATLGILVLFVAAGLGLVAAFSGGFINKQFVSYSGQTPTGSQPSGKTTAENISQLEPSATAIGKTVNAGDLSWTVTDAHEAREVTKAGSPRSTRPGNFITVNFSVKNEADYPITLTPEVLNVFANDGLEYPPRSNVNGGYVDDIKNILFNQESILQPGETKGGQANFELPNGLSGILLQVGNPNSSEKKYVELGT